jgi:hypothetical protein
MMSTKIAFFIQKTKPVPQLFTPFHYLCRKIQRYGKESVEQVRMVGGNHLQGKEDFLRGNQSSLARQ